MSPQIPLSIKSFLHFCIISLLFSYPRHPGHVARVSPAGTPLPHLPSPDLSHLLCHLRPNCPVRAGQRGRGRSDEAPGGQQQGGTAGGDGGEGREEGERGGQPTPQHGDCGQRPGAERGHTRAGNRVRVHVSACVRGQGVEVTITVTAVIISCGRCRLRMRSVPMATC